MSRVGEERGEKGVVGLEYLGCGLEYLGWIVPRGGGSTAAYRGSSLPSEGVIVELPKKRCSISLDLRNMYCSISF